MIGSWWPGSAATSSWSWSRAPPAPQDIVAVADAALSAVSRPVVIAGATYNVTASAGLVEREAAGADSGGAGARG